MHVFPYVRTSYIDITSNRIVEFIMFWKRFQVLYIYTCVINTYSVDLSVYPRVSFFFISRKGCAAVTVCVTSSTTIGCK